MGEPTTHLPDDAEAFLRSAYAALNRGDVAAFVSIFDPQVERVEFEGTPQAGTFRGIDAMTAHVAAGRGGWAEGACEPERVVVGAGGRAVVLVRVRVRLKHETEWREGRVGDGFAFRDGRVIEFNSFADTRDALKWAGVDPADRD